ncbi:unnamed protein product [Polarella glacialis]|uniref:Uncharacterized protein n=1 Tax=Polarella glacialis TaxID=89957 RepID=A0A813DR56_POLGL|nr:unnamed protein product [Polarella glacialis]CAE8723171.1 unnamed protein product [Polarella glacialis]
MSEIQAQGRSDQQEQQEQREEAARKREEKREEAHASKMEHEQEMREEAKMREAAKSRGKFGGAPLKPRDAALHQPDHGGTLLMDEEHRIGRRTISRRSSLGTSTRWWTSRTAGTAGQ